MTNLRSLAPLVALLLAACGGPAPDPVESTPSATESPEPGGEATTDPTDTPPAIAAEDVFPASFRALGTEPFWAIHVGEERLRYMTPEDQQGQSIPFTREQTAQDRVTLSAELDGKPLILSGRIEECSDGMSDRVYPYAVTLQIGDEILQGCARPTDS